MAQRTDAGTATRAGRRDPGERGRLGREERREALLDAASALAVGGEPEAITMDAVAERAGVSRPLVYRHFPNREDLIAAGMYILPRRCKQIAFANPTYSVGDAFLVKARNPKNLHSYEDVAKNSKARLGVVVGTVEQQWAGELGVPSDRLVIFPDTPSALAGVQSDRVDAFAGTSLTVQDLLRKLHSKQLAKAQPFKQPVINGVSVRGYGAFGFRKSDAAFREAFNKRMAAFIGTPRYTKIMSRFGFGKDNLPGKMTAKDLCQRER